MSTYRPLSNHLDSLDALVEVVREEYANLLAAAQATLAADAEGETDALYYLRDELSHTTGTFR